MDVEFLEESEAIVQPEEGLSVMDMTTSGVHGFCFVDYIPELDLAVTIWPDWQNERGTATSMEVGEMADEGCFG